MMKKYHKKIKSPLKRKQALAKFDALFSEEKFNFFKGKLSCNTFTYFVDDIPVKGYVIKPKTSKEALPVLIYNRGGNGNYGAVVFGSMMQNLFPIAAQGFIVIGTQYRGTFTRNPLISDEFGGADVKRIGMFGASRGGMQTYLALKKLKNVKAIAVMAGVTDLQQELNFRPEMERVYMHRIPNYKENKIKALEKRSVLKWVETLPKNVPILLLHGKNDKRVSVNNSIIFSDALSQHNIPNKLIIYPNDNHFFIKNKNNVNKELVNWFKKYL